MSLIQGRQRGGSGTYKPVSLASPQGHLTPRTLIKQTILETISKHMKDRKVIWNSEHGFMKGESSLTNLIAFCDEVTGSMDEGRVVDVFCLDFS